MLKRIVLSIIIVVLYYSSALSQDIRIIVKLNEEIITNLDINFEKKYLIFLNENLKQLDQKDLDIIAKNSLIREKIKEKEIKNFFDLKQNYEFEDKLLADFYKRRKFKNKEELLDYLKNKKISFNKIKKKLKIETLWNQVIYNKFHKNIKIDNEYLKNQIIEKNKNKKKNYDYNLSEILFEVDGDEKNKLKKIKKSIDKIGFKNTANKLSISETSNFGGEIGWVKGSQLSENIEKKIYNISIGEISDPIKTSNGYLILKINDKKEIKKELNLDNELKLLINYEKNRQLNQFSIIYYKRLKQNTNIDEFK